MNSSLQADPRAPCRKTPNINIAEKNWGYCDSTEEDIHTVAEGVIALMEEMEGTNSMVGAVTTRYLVDVTATNCLVAEVR